jgi:peptidyl-prolyl cis-trans isomerase C
LFVTIVLTYLHLCIASIAVVFAHAALAQSPASLAPDTILVEKDSIKVTKHDFDLEVARLPPEYRATVVNSQRRISEIVGRLLVMKTLAQEARAKGIDRDPEVAAKLALETDRLYASVRQSQVEDEAASEFDAKRAQWEARARELYASDRNRFMTPDQVSASHILFSLQQHSSDEAKKLAQAARARIAAGTDFDEIAKSQSEDPAAKQNGGRLGFFARSDVHPAFANAAFALKKVGDVSEPVLTSFGWHLIRLDGRRASSLRPFEEVRDLVLAELKQQYMNERRDAMLNAIGNDPAVKPNIQALDSLYIRPTDESALRRAMPASTPKAPR